MVLHANAIKDYGYKNEKDLQFTIAKVLEIQGVDVQVEAQVSEGLRADIVTPNSVIEVKHILKRESLFSAVGQVLVYKHQLNKQNAVIFGCQVGTTQYVKYFRAIKPIVNIVHAQAAYLRGIRNYLNYNLYESIYDFRGKVMSESDIRKASMYASKLKKDLFEIE